MVRHIDDRDGQRDFGKITRFVVALSSTF